MNFERPVEQRNGAPDRCDVPDLQSMISTSELNRRSSRPPDYETENRALIALAREMATSPDGILQKLADTALTLCRAHSAGLSLLEEGDQKRRFHWRAIAGQWAPHVDGGTPRDFGPCGTVLDRNVALLCSRPERDFPYWANVKPVLEEGLLIPFYILGEAVGTIWVAAHDTSRRFDAEDLRVMTSLGTFTAAAYQTWLSLRETQQTAAIIAFSDDAIVSKDLDGIIRSWNKAAERMFGYAAEEVIGKPITILIPLGRLDEEPEILERIKRGEPVDYETVRQRKDGSQIEISLTVSPVKNAQGKVIGASKIARDITERKRAEDRQKLLVAELDHRVKNILAQVAAVAKSTRQSSQSIDGFLQSLDGRIQSMAAAHGLLSATKWQDVGLVALVRNQLAPYARDANIAISGTDVSLTAAEIQALAMVLHELVTNAAKHGALSVSDGKVSVSWDRRRNGYAAENLILVWREVGGPSVTANVPSGYGTTLIRNLVPHELGGTVNLEFVPDGVRCRMEIPLSRFEQR